MFSAAKELRFSMFSDSTTSGGVKFQPGFTWVSWQADAGVACGLLVGEFLPDSYRFFQGFHAKNRTWTTLAELKFKNPFLPVRSLVYGALSPSCCLVDCQWFLFILGRVGRWDDGPRPQHPQNSMESLAVSSWRGRISPIWPSILGVNQPCWMEKTYESCIELRQMHVLDLNTSAFSHCLMG